ncbi:MAG TPA: hypothetical protein VFA20_03095 [Myxococcaceae bacterium]|nr:hypothetical protein [Myxococcaceae bacterium]
MAESPWRRFWEKGLRDTGRDVWLSASALAVGASALAYAIHDNNGNQSPTAIALLTVAILCAALAVLHPQIPFVERWGDRPAMLILTLAIVGEMGLAFITSPGIYLRVQPMTFVIHHLLVAVAAVLAGAQLAEKPWLGRTGMALVLGVSFALGIWMVISSPAPAIDAWYWHRTALQALFKGVDPYSISMPNIYGHTAFYGEGLATPTQVNVGYPYPPLSLLIAVLGNLFGDYRMANVAAITAAGGLIAWMRPGRISRAAAILFLFSPRELFVVEQGWTEGHVVLMLVGVVFVAARSPRFLRWAFGALVAVKQYGVLTTPLLALVVRPGKEWARVVGGAAALALLLTVPMALWDVPGFIKSVVLFQAKQPFRAEALSYVAWTARPDGVPRLPLWFSFAVLPVPLALSLWRSPRTAAGFGVSSAFAYVMFFGFAKQAFTNYYFMVLAALCAALAALAPEAPRSQPEATG